MEEIEDDIAYSGDDEDDGADETNVDVVALPECRDDSDEGTHDVGTPTPRRGEKEISKRKKRKKSPFPSEIRRRRTIYSWMVDGGGRNSKEAPLPGRPKIRRLKRAL